MEMTADELLEWAKKSDEIVDPIICDNLLFWASSWQMDYENSLSTIDIQVSNKRIELIKQHKSRSMADAYLELEDIYQQQQSIERRINQLKAFKGNVRRRYELLTNQILSKHRH